MQSIPIRLDYNAVEIIRQAYDIESGRGLWQRIQTIEAIAIEHMLAEAKRNNG